MNYKTVIAGLTQSTVYPSFDFETYSEAGYEWSEIKCRWVAPDGFPNGKAGLPSIGAARYAEDPTTEVLSLAYDILDGRGKILWVPGMPDPQHLFDYLAQPDAIIEAHNSMFEYLIWHYVCHLRMGWPPLRLNQLRCSMSKCAAWGLPGALDKVSKILNNYGY